MLPRRRQRSVALVVGRGCAMNAALNSPGDIATSRSRAEIQVLARPFTRLAVPDVSRVLARIQAIAAHVARNCAFPAANEPQTKTALSTPTFANVSALYMAHAQISERSKKNNVLALLKMFERVRGVTVK